jgi:hypothetical protein
MATRRAPQIPGEAPHAEEHTVDTEERPPLMVDSDDIKQVGEVKLRAADVDPTKIRRAVLTADGWVCPDKLPEPKARE